MKCLHCNSPLRHKILDLQFSPLANSFVKEIELGKPEYHYPLQLYVCSNCQLVQTAYVANAEDIFNDKYLYQSSVSNHWTHHCRNYADEIYTELKLNPESFVLEVGCNDGLLISMFKEKGIPSLGVDPAAYAGGLSPETKAPVLQDFFSVENVVKYELGQKADLIIGNNVIAHVPNTNDLMKAVRMALKSGGTCTFEFPYLFSMLENNQFDTVYHEHFFYFSITAIKNILNHAGLKPYKLKHLSTHGGSIRLYACHMEDSKEEQSSLLDQLQFEEKAGLYEGRPYEKLQQRTEEIRIEFLEWLLANRGKKIMAYGAAAKGNTFLNFCGIDIGFIPCVVDKTPQKQGMYLPGSHIPVVGEEEIERQKPDYLVVLPWNFKEEIRERLAYTKEWGCRLVSFIPSFCSY